MTVQEAAALVALVKARYPQFPVADAEAAARAWQMTLRDVPYEACELVLGEWFRTQRYWPDPAELRNRVLAALAEVPDAADAWLLVLTHMRANGPLSGVRFDAPEAVRRAVEAIGGMHRLRASERPEDDRRAFMDAYAVYARRMAATADVAALLSERVPELSA